MKQKRRPLRGAFSDAYSQLSPSLPTAQGHDHPIQ